MSDKLQLPRRLVRIAIMLAICTPALIASNHPGFYDDPHRESLLLFMMIVSLAFAFWTMDKLAPMKRARMKP